MIMSVKHIGDYQKIMNYLFLETHRYPGKDHTSPLQEDPEADSVIIQMFSRDLVYYNNIQKLIKNKLKIKFVCVYIRTVLYIIYAHFILDQ